MTDPVLIRGGGEMASGVAYVLQRAGYRTVITEVAAPRAIRRTVAFAEAVYQGACQIEHITGRLVTPEDVESCWSEGSVPVVVDSGAKIRTQLTFPVIVDALMSKQNAGGTSSDWAPLVIGLGPGLSAPQDCHVVVETLRGHYLGRIYDRGTTLPNTGEPSELGGESATRVLRAPVEGPVQPALAIGEQVSSGDLVATVAGQPVYAALGGVLRGVMAPGCKAMAGEKIADIDPRGRAEYCRFVSEKARLIGAGVRAAIDWWFSGRQFPLGPAPDAV